MNLGRIAHPYTAKPATRAGFTTTNRTTSKLNIHSPGEEDLPPNSVGLRAIVESAVRRIRYIQAEVLISPPEFGVVTGKQIGACVGILNGPFSTGNGKLMNGSPPVEHVATKEKSVIKCMPSRYGKCIRRSL